MTGRDVFAAVRARTVAALREILPDLPEEAFAKVLQMLFTLLHGEPRQLPPWWQAKAGEAGSREAAAAVCDYLAGMTDRYALEEHRRLTDPSVPG
jgi:dGTP triphosphohydrolase